MQQRLKATEDHPFAVKRHVAERLHARVAHKFFVACISAWRARNEIAFWVSAPKAAVIMGASSRQKITA